MTSVDESRASDTDEGMRKPPPGERDTGDRRRLGPALTDAQFAELRALGHQLLNPRSD